MSRKYEATPTDSRYIPFTQQSYCCVPTSIQMVMYRRGLPLVPAEEIGYQLGLTVPPEDKELFYNVRVSETPPVSSGFGTQIQKPEYSPNEAFKRLGIGLNHEMVPISSIESAQDLQFLLESIEAEDKDALLCFNHGVIRGAYQPNTGHVVVFDRFIDGKVRIVDASPRNPKWRSVEVELLFDAMKQHGDENSGGLWLFNTNT